MKPAILAAALAIALPVYAADPARLQSYGLGMDEGLANNSVYCAIQDHAGLMWFGTFGGLSRYDGESFVTYRPGQGSDRSGSLAASVVFALLEDSQGRLWIGTDGGGLALYKSVSDSFEVFRAEPGRDGALTSDRVFALGEDGKGRLWVGLGDGAFGTFDPETLRFENLSPAEAGGSPVRCIIADARGGVWAGTEGGGLFRFDPSSALCESFRHEAGREDSLGSNVVRSILEDAAGRIWVGLGNGGVELFDEGRFRRALPREGAKAPVEAVRSLAQDSEGTIWVGYADSGLGTVDTASLTLRPPKPGAEAMVRTIYADRRGLMWVGLKEGGLRTFNLRSALFSRFVSRSDGRPLRDLRGISQDRQGRILVGSDGGGILVIDGEKLSALPGLPSDKEAQKVYAVLAERDGTVWAGTDGGGLIAVDSSGRARSYRHSDRDPDSLASDVVWTLYADLDGTLWVGTEGGGLDRLDRRTEKFAHYRPNPHTPSIRGSSVRAICRDSAGRLWVGTWDGGLSRLEPNSSIFIGYGPESGDPSSIGDASINCIFEDAEGAIWVGTGGSGLAKLDPAMGRFTHFSEAEGLMGATVYGIVEDHSGDLWISTSRGLSRFDREAGTFFYFGVEDGLASKELAQNSLFRARDGMIWAGGMNGLTRFDPLRLPRFAPQPAVAITGIEISGAGEGAPKIADDVDGRGELELGYRNSGLSFRIAVLDYASLGRNRYAMKLEGRQQGWTYLGTHNAGTIAPLPPGTYVLRARGANGNGVWNEEGAELTIRVRSPFWGTWWFRIAASIAFLALIAGAITMRLRGLNRRNALLVNFSQHIEAAREEERIAAAREVHDEIGQHLAALNIQAYWLRGHPDAPIPMRDERFDEMLGSISDAMGAVKSVATKLRPIALDALSFDEALRWYLRSFEQRSGVKTSTEIGKGIPQVEGLLATALFRVLQEMLTNVLRHSGALNVRLRYVIEDGYLLLEVHDDGKGIEEGRAEAEDSFGIIGMRERCAAFGGTLEVSGASGHGTTFAARVPLDQSSTAGRSDAGNLAWFRRCILTAIKGGRC